MSIGSATKVEIGLVGGLLLNAVAFGIFIAKVNTLSDSVSGLTAQLAILRDQQPEIAVLKYRVEQLELRVSRIR